MKTVQLTTLTPLAEGNRRLVFQHPEDQELLIKVLKPGSYAPDGQPRRRRVYKLRRREGAFVYHTRELHEYVAARISNRSPHGLPICSIQGLVETDLGLGLTVEKLTDRDGGLAPTLRQVIERGEFDAAARRLFERFIQELIDKHVVVYELSVDNIVLAKDGRDGRRFVCIDGMGCRTLIPIQEWSKWINARKIREFQAEFQRQWTKAAMPARGLTFLPAPTLLVLLAVESLI